MSTTQRSEFETLPVPVGVWRADPATAHLGFRAKSMWGLVPVKGRFSSYAGTLEVDEVGVARGELTVQAASLDTKNKKRDEHLRSADFFDVVRHPTIRFASTAITSRPGGLTISGDLHVGTTVSRLQLPVTVTRVNDDRLRLQASTSVPREKVGLNWNKGGMIRGDAHLSAEIDLVREA